MSKPLDRLTLLETFARIAERGSITRAARDLRVSQATASRQLRELEDRLGTQLVRRTTHSLSLTAAGEGLLADARALLSGWEALAERHGMAGEVVRGPLKIVAPVALGQSYLADIAVRFQTAHPEVAIDWQLDDEAVRFAETGCDCWIRVGSVPDDTLIVRNIGSIERLVVASPTFMSSRAIRNPQDLEDLPCAALEPFEGRRISLFDGDGRRVTVSPPVGFSTNNFFAVHRAALLGAGFAILPKWYVERDLTAGRLVDCLPDWRAATLPLHAAFLPVRYHPRRLLRFLDALAEGIGTIDGLQAPNRVAGG